MLLVLLVVLLSQVSATLRKDTSVVQVDLVAATASPLVVPLFPSLSLLVTPRLPPLVVARIVCDCAIELSQVLRKSSAVLLVQCPVVPVALAGSSTNPWIRT